MAYSGPVCDENFISMMPLPSEHWRLCFCRGVVTMTSAGVALFLRISNRLMKLASDAFPWVSEISKCASESLLSSNVDDVDAPCQGDCVLLNVSFDRRSFGLFSRLRGHSCKCAITASVSRFNTERLCPMNETSTNLCARLQEFYTCHPHREETVEHIA